LANGIELKDLLLSLLQMPQSVMFALGLSNCQELNAWGAAKLFAKDAAKANAWYAIL
jgi:hypothetical protein